MDFCIDPWRHMEHNSLPMFLLRITIAAFLLLSEQSHASEWSAQPRDVVQAKLKTGVRAAILKQVLRSGSVAYAIVYDAHAPQTEISYDLEIALQVWAKALDVEKLKLERAKFPLTAKVIVHIEDAHTQFDRERAADLKKYEKAGAIVLRLNAADFLDMISIEQAIAKEAVALTLNGEFSSNSILKVSRIFGGKAEKSKTSQIANYLLRKKHLIMIDEQGRSVIGAGEQTSLAYTWINEKLAKLLAMEALLATHDTSHLRLAPDVRITIKFPPCERSLTLKSFKPRVLP
jgi:hypothetical protein